MFSPYATLPIGRYLSAVQPRGTSPGGGRNTMPDFKIERRCRGLVCGIDEAGRGPLAGPVVAAAVILEPRRLPKMLRDGLDDSKLLTRVQRTGCFRALRPWVDRGAAPVSRGAAGPSRIAP